MHVSRIQLSPAMPAYQSILLRLLAINSQCRSIDLVPSSFHRELWASTWKMEATNCCQSGRVQLLDQHMRRFACERGHRLIRMVVVMVGDFTMGRLSVEAIGSS